MQLIETIENELKKPAGSLPAVHVGDTVEVHYLIREGDKERVQIFQGTVLGVRGSGIRRTMKVRRIVAGEGVERTFPLHSPKLAGIEVTRMGRVRRAKLYYLRQRVGKATRVKQIFVKKTKKAATEPEPEPTRSAAV